MISSAALVGIYALLNAVEASPLKLQARDCSLTWPAYDGDNCATFADNWSISEAQFLSFNPGAVCSALEVGKEYCIEWSGTPPPLPVKPTPTPTPVVTPTPATTTKPTQAPVATCASTPAGVVTPSPIQVHNSYLNDSSHTLTQPRPE
jgi:cell division septation protein DedD